MSSGNNDSIILEEEIDPNYVPTEEEVVEYAKWLGMDLDVDSDLFWIAREGLMAPLPPYWKPCKSKDSEEVYYFNFDTAESSWDHPCDGYYKRLYEEEKKKKEINKKAENDTTRMKARQDVDQLLGKKKKSKSVGKEQGPARETAATAKAAPVAVSSLGKSALPGIRGKAPLQEALPLSTLSRASTPERGRSIEITSISEVRPASADSVLGVGRSQAISQTAVSLRAPLLPATASRRSPSPEFTDSDVSPDKPEPKSRDLSDTRRSEEKSDRKGSKSSRIHSAVAESSDFGSPDIKIKDTMAPKGPSKGAVADPVAKPKLPLGKIGSSLPPPQVDLAAAALQQQELSRDLENLKNDHTELSADNANMTLTLSEVRAELDRERKKSEALLTSRDLLQAQLSTARDENRNIRSELNKEIDRRAKVETELKEVLVQWNNAKKENTSHLITINDLRGQLHNLEGELSYCKSHLREPEEPPPYPVESRESPPRAAASSSVSDEAYTDLRAKHQDALAKIAELEQRAARMEMERKSIEFEFSEEKDRMQTSLRTALRDRDSQAAEAERYSRKIRILESELSSSMGVGRIVGAEAEEDSTKTALMNANAQLKKMSSELREARESAEELAFKVKRLESQVSIRQSELDETEARASVLKKRVGELQDSLDEGKVALRSLSHRISCEADEKSRLESLLASANTEIKSLRSQLASREHDQLFQDDNRRSFQEVHENFQPMKNRVVSLQSEVDELSLQLTRRDSEISRLNFEIATQSEMITNLRKESTNAHNADTDAITAVLKRHEKDLIVKLETARNQELALTSDLNEYKEKTEMLEQELQQARSQIDRLVQKDKANQALLSNQEVLLIEFEKKNSDLLREVNELSLKTLGENGAESRRMQILEMEIDRYKSLLQERQLSSADTRVPHIQEDVVREHETLLKSLADSNLDLTTSQNALIALKESLSHRNAQIESLQGELMAARHQMEQARLSHLQVQSAQLMSSSEKIEAYAEEHAKDMQKFLESKLQIQQLLRNVTELETEIVSLKADLETERAAKGKLVNKAAVAEADLVEFRLGVDVTQAENRVLREKNDKLFLGMLERDKQITELQQQLGLLDRENQKSKRSNSESLREDATVKGIVSSLEKPELDDRDDKIKELLNLLAQKEQEIARLKGEISALHVEKAVLKNELASRSAECANLRETIDSQHRNLAGNGRLEENVVRDVEVSNNQKRDAVDFFDSLMTSYKSKLEEAFEAQLRSVTTAHKLSSAGRHNEQEGNVKSETGYRVHEAPSLPISPNRQSSTPAVDMMDFKVHEDSIETSPLETLKNMLSSYMSQTNNGHVVRSRESVPMSTRDSEMQHIGNKIREQRGLLEELKKFLKSENDFVRQKQQVLARDRDLWRDKYQYGGVRNNDENFRASKKASGEALNHRAESLNGIIGQIKHIQQWLAARETKLARLELVWQSADNIELHHRSPTVYHDDKSLNDHKKLLRGIELELDDDISIIGLNSTESTRKDNVQMPKRTTSPVRNETGISGGFPSQTQSSHRISAVQKPTPSYRSNALVFAQRLGNHIVETAYPSAAVGEYSNNLRSSLNAYDTHADWLGNLRREVASFGSGARRSYEGVGAINQNFVTRKAADKEWKALSDYMSQTKSLFKSESGHYLEKAESVSGLRRSIDNGEIPDSRSHKIFEV